MKYKITAPVKTNETLYGITFVNGVGKTSNDYIAGVLKNQGFRVEPAGTKKSEDVKVGEADEN